MNIITGIIFTAIKILIYGVEGIGKTTLASQFPDPLFIDTEGGTHTMNVKRFEAASDWPALLEQVRYVIDHPDVCKTLVIDTADWAEQMCINWLCKKNGWKSIEAPGYGKGYTYVEEEFGKLLDLLSQLSEKGINVVINSHAQLRKIELPDEMGAYDHYEVKTTKKAAPMLREWADMVLFCNYKTNVVNIDGVNKARGGKRVMYTSHTPFWDAKNRYGLPDELPLEYQAIKHIIEPDTPTKETARSEEAPKEKEDEKPVSKETLDKLRSMMSEAKVTEKEIQRVVADKKHYPSETPIAEYTEKFVNKWVMKYWDKIISIITTNREKGIA